MRADARRPPPSGRPVARDERDRAAKPSVGGLYHALRVAALAGLDADDRALLVGGTMAAALDGRDLPTPQPPRLNAVRTVNGALLRIGAYLMMGFAAAMLGGGSRDVTRAAPGIALARSVCRDPDPGAIGPALARMDAALSAAERLLTEPTRLAMTALGLLHACAVLAATEPPTRPA